jgi:hypothetical protein
LSAAPATVFFGFAVSSRDNTTQCAARFRDFGPGSSLAVETFTPGNEPLGPSSRATGLIISELMYHPGPRPDGKRLEFLRFTMPKRFSKI